MHTDTGRIYSPLQMEELERASRRGDFTEEDVVARTRAANDLSASLRAEAEVREALREHDLSYDDVVDLAAGKIVPVSEQVVQKVRLGERELERRRRRSKAAKQARKRHR